ncbi:hypothetical protein OK016_14265 [Vibrio chagasii]|nr:hypothetical protein [Vibrio chagasii]
MEGAAGSANSSYPLFSVSVYLHRLKTAPVGSANTAGSESVTISTMEIATSQIRPPRQLLDGARGGSIPAFMT